MKDSAIDFLQQYMKGSPDLFIGAENYTIFTNEN